MKKHEPAARSTMKRSLRPLGPPLRAGTSPSAATATDHSKSEFQQIVHELQVHQEELEAQNEELRETQQLLEASRDRYADLYDFAPIGYATLDGKGHISEINLTGATVLGRERSRLLGTLFSVAVAKNNLGAFHGHLRQCQQNSGPVTTELTLAIHNRDPVPVQLYSVPILDLVGQTTMYRTAITDITVRRQAEKASIQLAAIVESSDDAIIGKNLDGIIQSWNAGAERVFGYTAGEMVGASIALLLPADRQEEEKHILDKVKRGESVVHFETVRQAKNRRLIDVSVTVSPIKDLTGEIVGASKVARDITERKQAEKILRLAHDQLEDRVRERTVELAEAVANLRKEISERERAEQSLRELSVRLLRSQDEERRRIARELHDSTGQKMAALAMNLSLIGKSAGTLDAPARKALAESLALLDQSSSEIRTLSYLLHPPLLDERGLAAAVRWFTDGFSQRSGVQVKLKMPADLPRLADDIEIALFRIVQEGLTNIHRHSGSSAAMIRLIVDQNHVQLEVQDAGKGLPQSRADGPVDAMGVGITGMRERVKQLGGQMKIESSPRGTTVSVTLPLAGAAS